MSSSYQVVEADLERLTGEWEQLLDEADCRWPFLHPSWLRVWWTESAPPGRPLILSVREGERLAGVVPLILDDSQLSLAGDSSICDYMDLVTCADERLAILDAVLSWTVALSWQEFVLWGIRADSPTIPALQSLAGQHSLALSIEREAVSPRISLPETWEQYLEGLSKKDRHELRRKMRRFFEVSRETESYSLSAPDAVGAAIDDFVRLHRISRQDKAEFMTPAMERFFRRMAMTLSEENMVRLFFLELDRRRVASVLAFDCGDELWLYNSGYDPAFASVSVGLVSKALILRQAIEEGKHCYDLLRGTESYKYDLGARDLEIFRCTLSRDPLQHEARAAGKQIP